MMGLGGIAPGAKPATPALDPEVAKEKFGQLYGSKTLYFERTLTWMQTWK
jgi:hypothetical protein